ncbi:hypothetical protein [Halorussus salinisoli]|uniref:hypothetical protein n=1 Tax=Halorussus salinisoli TaxID=2558242 RepID=UPI0010C245F1|nr:hypothetical protein [Halorussus salinisoli]
MEERTLKGVAIAALTLVTVLALTASSSSASGYEISIYAAYPWWFWGGIVATFVLGTVVVLGSTDVPHRRRYLALGAGIILFANTFLLFMPVIRGYAVFGGGDMFTHLGRVIEILENGRVNEGNYYPGIHIHAVMVMEVTGLDYYAVKNVLAPVFSVAYWFGILALGVRVTDEPAGFHYLVPFALLPIFKRTEVYFGPNMLSFSLYPLLLYALFSVRRSRNRFVAVVSLVFCYFVFTHPVTTLLGLFTVALVAASKLATSRLRGDRLPVKQSLSVVAIPVAVGVVFVSWYYSFLKILTMTVSMLGSLFLGIGTSQLGEYSNALRSVPLEPADLLEVVVFRKGLEILLMVGTVVVVLYLAYHVRYGERELRWQDLFWVAGFGLFSVLAAAFLVKPIMLTWTRLLKFAEFFAVLLVATAAYVYVGGSRRSFGTRHVVVVGVVLVLFSLVVFGAYDSPLQRGTNSHVPETRLDGMEWFVDHRDDDRLAYGFSHRWEHAFRGVAPNPRAYAERPIPERFGYHNASTFATPNHAGSYLLVTQRLEEYYPTLHPEYPEYWKYRPSDFRRLDRDEGLGKVYANGGIRIYRASSEPVGTPSGDDATGNATVNATESVSANVPESATASETRREPVRGGLIRGGPRWSGG